MSTYNKRAAYKDHAQALQKTLGALTKDTYPRLVLLYGTNEYLLGRALQKLRLTLSTRFDSVSALEASTLNESALNSLFAQASLFDSACVYIIRRCEQAKTLAKMLKSIPPSHSDNIVILVAQSDSVSALQTEVSRLQGVPLPCYTPWPNEVASIAQQMANEASLNLHPDALHLLLEVCGQDLAKLDNEMHKLGLIFAHRQGSKLGASDIGPHLGVLREDEAFELDKLLLNQQWAKAQALLSSLLERGEKALALLGILATHCRHAARITEALKAGLNATEIAQQIRLPPFVLKTYIQSLQRTVNSRHADTRYLEALKRCYASDLLIKTSAMREDLILSQIIDDLSRSGMSPT